MEVCIRVDGSHEIGLGHLYRSSTIADRAIARGHNVVVLTETPEFASQIIPDQADIMPIEDVGQGTTLAEWIAASEVDVTIIDCIDGDTDCQQRLSTPDSILTVISDDARYEISADILVNGNLYANEIDYDWTQTEPKWCLGTEYLILREPFRSYASRDQPFPETVSNILVTMGGVDKKNRTPTVLSAIGHFELSVTAVIGPGFKNQEEIRKVAADLTCPIKVQENPDNLAKLFLNADLAVCTLGTTTYELLSTQTPIIGIPDNETPIDQALAARNAAVVLSRNPTSNEIRNAVDRVMSDKELRRSLWRAGDQIVSGDGAKKIIRAIEKTMGDQL